MWPTSAPPPPSLRPNSPGGEFPPVGRHCGHQATEVPDDFNAIGSCLRKEYTYRIYNSRIRNAFLVNRVWFYPKKLDETVMHQAAQYFVGTMTLPASVPWEPRPRPPSARYIILRSPGRETSSPAGFVQTDFSTTWCGPWWGPAFTPPRESSPPTTSLPCWKGETAPMPAPLPPSGAVHDQPLVSHRRAPLMHVEERPLCRPLEVLI